LCKLGFVKQTVQWYSLFDCMEEIIKNKVNEYRLKSGLTQEELADKVGVTRQTIIAIERGNYTPSVLLALKLARVFKVSVELLFSIGYE